MNEKEQSQNEELEIDLSKLLKLLKKNLKKIIASTVVCAVILFVFTYFVVDKKYASTATIFITPKITDQGTIDTNSANTNSKMVNNYMELLKGENILTKVAEQLAIKDVASIKEGISVTNTTGSEVIKVTVTTKDPKLSQQVAESTVNTFFEEMKDKLNIENLTIISNPKINESPVSPNLKLNTLIGALIGMIISCGIVFLHYLLDKRLRNREEAENFLGIPVLVEVPYYEED